MAVLSDFRYENPGLIERTVTYGTTVQCDSTQSVTGYACWIKNRQKAFPLPSTDYNEIWIRFDAYFKTVTSALRVYAYNSDVDIIGAHIFYNGAIDVWNGPNNYKEYNKSITFSGLNSFILRIVKSSTSTSNDGIILLWANSDAEPLIAEYGINTYSSYLLTDIYLQSDSDDTVFSNIIISNKSLTMADRANIGREWVQPSLSKNGTFGEDELAIRRSDGSANIFNILATNIPDDGYGLREYIDIFIKPDLKIKNFIFVEDSSHLINDDWTILQSSNGVEYQSIKTVHQDGHYVVLQIDNNEQYHYYRFVTANDIHFLTRLYIDAETENDSSFQFDLSRKLSNSEICNFDLSRKLSNRDTETFDLLRIITDKQIVAERFDLSRKVSRTVSESFDLKRSLPSSNFHLTESFDIARNVLRTVSETFDLSRKLSELVVQHHSTDREVYFNLVQNHSTWRSVNGTVSIRFDTCVKSNQVFSYTGNRLFTPGGMRLASFSIEINESSVSDKITLGIANNILQPLSSVKGKLLDYDYDMLVQSTQQQGILTTVQTMLDWKKVTGTVLRYPDFDGSGKAKSSSTNQSPRVDFDYIGGELRIWATIAGSIDSSKKKPTTKASCHLDYIAKAMGYSSCEKYFDDFTPSNGCANESASYISLISNFFSWTKDIPWHEINVFGRGNTLYAVQRGHEPNTVDITTMRHTVPTVLREAVMIYKAKIKVDGDGAKVKLDVSKEDGISANKYDNYRNSYHTGNSSHSVGYDKAGRPISHKIENADGSTETIEYEYSGDSYVDRVHEIHTRTDKNGKTEVTEVWHTSIGSGREITDGSGSDGSISGSALTTNRTSDFSSTGDKLIVTASMDGNRSATYIADDTYGNYMKWTTSDDGSDSDPFPIVGGGYDYFDEIKAYNGNKVQEIRTLDIMSPVRNGVPDYKHIIDYRDAILLDGNKYYLVSNSVNLTPVEFKQSLKIIRWE
jgi:hypothetical protein